MLSIRAWMLAYGERIGTSDRGCNPLRKIHFFVYVRQDATVLSGELANEENQGGVRRYCFFSKYARKINDF